MRSRLSPTAISILFMVMLLNACAVNPLTGKRELMLVSENQELSLGKKSAPAMKWESGGQYRDSAIESYLDSIVREIWMKSERPHLPVSFYIQNTSVPNAFALPGYVAITRGLLSKMENKARFAAVIGHEIGHVMARHSAQRISRVQLQQLGFAAGSADSGRITDGPLRSLNRAPGSFPATPSPTSCWGKHFFISGICRRGHTSQTSGQAVPKHPGVHGLPGICYENTGKMRSALQEYMLQFEVAPDTDLGRFAGERLGILRQQLNVP